jgi:hypothetical protein
MTKDSRLMFEKYVSHLKNKILKEQALLQNSAQAEKSAQHSRLVEVVNIIRGDKSIFNSIRAKLAQTPEEFLNFLKWAQQYLSSSTPTEADEMGASGDNSGESVGVSDASPVGEGTEKEEKKIEKDKILKHKSEETEQEYLDKRDKAIKDAIAAQEESEEQQAVSTHYNINHHALDLVNGLLNHPKKYSKAEAIKILQIASDKLQNKL